MPVTVEAKTGNSVDAWIIRATAFLTQYQKRLEAAPKSPATDKVATEVDNLLTTVPVGEGPDDGEFSGKLAQLLDCEDDAEDILEEVESITVRLDSMAEALGRPDPNKRDLDHLSNEVEHAAGMRSTAEALAEALGLSDVQMGLIGTSGDPVGAAKRELARVTAVPL